MRLKSFHSDSGISSTCSDAYLDMKPLVTRSQISRSMQSMKSLFLFNTWELIPWYFKKVILK